MKILIVCSKNSGRIAPFITDQAEALKREGIEVDFFTIEGKGWFGYLKSRSQLLKKINTFKPDILHAHYGLSGLLANLQRKVPVVTTYHGSDINNDKVFRFSKLAIRLSAYNIFVSEKNLLKSIPEVSIIDGVTQSHPVKGQRKEKYSLIPCGVDIELFHPMDKQIARKELNLDATKKYVLFSGAFSNQVKNPELALNTVGLLTDVELLELKGYTREQVALLMNAVDCVLMTSFTEGSPQFIKEAMACNCPVVSVPVGDVPEVIDGISGCFIASYEPKVVADKLKHSLAFNNRTEGRKVIIKRGLDAQTVARRIGEVYRLAVND